MRRGSSPAAASADSLTATEAAAAAFAARAASVSASAAARFSHQGPGTKPALPSGIRGDFTAGESFKPLCDKYNNPLRYVASTMTNKVKWAAPGACTMDGDS